MAPSLRSASLVAVALAPLAAEAGFPCQENYAAKSAGALCSGVNRRDCSNDDCCDEVTTCAAYACPGGWETKASPPANCGSSGCFAACCDRTPGICQTLTASGTGSCGNAWDFADPDRALRSVADATEYQATCCMMASKCEQFLMHFPGNITTDPSKAYDSSKAQMETTAADFANDCQSARGTCSASICETKRSVWAAKDPLPTSMCQGVECSPSECCDMVSGICGQQQSTACPSGQSYDWEVPFDGSAGTFAEQCCKDRLACDAYVPDPEDVSGAPAAAAGGVLACAAAAAAALLASSE